MIGIGAKLDKQTKIKILTERAKDYNAKYDSLIAQGLDPEQTASRLQQEEFQNRHGELLVEEPYKVPVHPHRPPRKSTRSGAQCISATPSPTQSPPAPNTSTQPCRA